MFGYMSDKQIADMLRAMFGYAKRGELPEFSNPLLNSNFCVMKYSIDRDNEKYQRICERNAVKGKKGGSPTLTTETQKTQWVFSKPKKPDNNNDNNNNNNNNNDNNISISSPSEMGSVKPLNTYDEFGMQNLDIKNG